MNFALPKCQTKGDPCISFAPDLTPLLHVVGWAFVACLVVHVVFWRLRRTGVWVAIGLGCVFWVLLWIATVLAAGRGIRLLFPPISVPAIAFGLSAVLVGSLSGSSPHGDATDDPP